MTNAKGKLLILTLVPLLCTKILTKSGHITGDTKKNETNPTVYREENVCTDKEEPERDGIWKKGWGKLIWCRP